VSLAAFAIHCHRHGLTCEQIAEANTVVGRCWRVNLASRNSRHDRLQVILDGLSLAWGGDDEVIRIFPCKADLAAVLEDRCIGPAH
jgi:hypothetical protein